MASASCPCGSTRKFEVCCEPYLTGTKSAPTAEALMRSRYTAYTRHDVAYIGATHDPKSPHQFDEQLARQWAESVDWKSLEIRSVSRGQEGDEEGMVEFLAHFSSEGKDYSHHERSLFRKHEGRWYYTDGKEIKAPVVRTEPKIGRNDPCVCGSGKKFKKCCGVNA